MVLRVRGSTGSLGKLTLQRDCGVGWRYQAWLLKKSLPMQKLPKLGDQKCIPRQKKSFIGHPSGSGFLGEDTERVFQHPEALSQPKQKSSRLVANC